MEGISYTTGLASLNLYFEFKERVEMEYKNGADLFPQELLAEIQRYVSGGLVYIPQTENNRKQWGANSGVKEEIRKRNLEIIQKFRRGKAICELESEYCLAFETIKKIVYTKKW